MGLAPGTSPVLAPAQREGLTPPVSAGKTRQFRGSDSAEPLPSLVQQLILSRMEPLTL
jgi:hypothetical protein